MSKKKLVLLKALTSQPFPLLFPMLPWPHPSLTLLFVHFCVRQNDFQFLNNQKQDTHIFTQETFEISMYQQAIINRVKLIIKYWNDSTSGGYKQHIRRTKAVMMMRIPPKQHLIVYVAKSTSILVRLEKKKAKKKREKTLLSKMHTHLFMLKTYISTLSTFIPQAVVASSRTTCKIRNQFKDILVDIRIKDPHLKLDHKFHV